MPEPEFMPEPTGHSGGDPLESADDWNFADAFEAAERAASRPPDDALTPGQRLRESVALWWEESDNIRRLLLIGVVVCALAAIAGLAPFWLIGGAAARQATAAWKPPAGTPLPLAAQPTGSTLTSGSTPGANATLSVAPVELAAAMPSPASGPASTLFPTAATAATASPTAEPPPVAAASAAPAATASPMPAPTASPTALPTASPTPVPTARPTEVPTASPTPVPTASPTEVPTDSPTPVPTASPTSIPTAAPPSPTPIPTVAPAAMPTATLRPIAPRPSVTARPSPVPVAVRAGTPSLLAPADRAGLSGVVTFQWQPAGPLPPGAAYEVVWWNSGENPALARGIAPATSALSLTANIDVVYESRQVTSSSLYWTVLVVRTAPYKRLTDPAQSAMRLLVYTPRGSGGGGSQPPPKPR